MAALATKPNTISTNPPTDALHELVVLQRGHLEEGHGTTQPQDAHLPAAAVPDHAGLDVHVCWVDRAGFVGAIESKHEGIVMLKRALCVNMHSLCTFILVQALLRPDVVSGGPPQQQLVLPAAPNLPGACVNQLGFHRLQSMTAKHTQESSD